MSSNSQLTRAQINEIREVFDVFDRDKSGNISHNELKTLFSALEIDATDQEVKEVLKQMDTDGDGEISFNEFLKVMGPCFVKRYSKKEIRDAFNYFDNNKDGYIEAHELKAVMKRIGKSYTDREIATMIKSVDLDRNGKISLDEFEKLINSY